MAKYEADIKGNLGDIIAEMETVIFGSLSASCEESSDYSIGNTRIAIRAYERYSVVGSNRVSLFVVFAEAEDDIHVSAVSTGGSQAIMYKINTFGEEAFLNRIVGVLGKYEIS